MSASKPEAGQWWFPDCVLTGQSAEQRGILIIGRTHDGRIVYQCDQHGYVETDSSGFDAWHHEPRCTGWDWVVPAEPTPPANQPDPDEWVVQDRVPVRVGIDEIHWSDWDAARWEVASGHWFPDTRLGSTQDGAILSVRCRRSDLPPVEKKTTDDFGMYLESVIAKDPQLKAEVDAAEAELAAIDARLNEPQPARRRVRLWLEGPTKMVMCRDKAPYGDWQVIHHDAAGFYVEESR